MKRFIAYTGTHGTGKSTSAAQAYQHHSVCYPTAPARLLCDLEADCPFPINQHTTARAQKWLFANQMLRELEAMKRFDVVITDRTIVDIIAYTYVAGFHDLAMGMVWLAEQHVAHYEEINFKQARHNNFWHGNGIREAYDAGFRIEVEDSLRGMYSRMTDSGFITGTIYYV